VCDADETEKMFQWRQGQVLQQAMAKVLQPLKALCTPSRQVTNNLLQLERDVPY